MRTRHPARDGQQEDDHLTLVFVTFVESDSMGRDPPLTKLVGRLFRFRPQPSTRKRDVWSIEMENIGTI
jgi:hypothetical protein